MGPKLTFSIEDLGKPIAFAEFNYNQWKAENPNVKDEVTPPSVAKTLTSIVSKDALQPLTKEGSYQ